MKANLKRVFVLSSLGSLALGAAVSLTRRVRSAAPSVPSSLEKIPDACKLVFLLTEHFTIEREKSGVSVQDEYRLESTQFKVWSIVDLPPSTASGRAEGARVFHVGWVRHLLSAEGSEEEEVLERFYGTIRVLDGEGRLLPANFVGRGRTIEIHKCHVGGASNGVETGEVHRSEAPLLNYRFEYTGE